jgi:Icc-related predicted phosphoesterase
VASVRILLTSDLHYRLRQYDWLVAHADRFDAIAIAGDHIDIASAVPSDVQVAALSASLEALSRRAPLLVCSGNHDLDTRGSDGEKRARWLGALRSERLAVDGDSREIGDAFFTACPWWDGPQTRDALRALLEAAAARRRPGQPWVWLYHAPPEGPLSWTGRRHFGDALLPELLEQHRPTVVLCGHIHEAPFRNGGGWCERRGETWLFNAGHQIGDVPARIEIDLRARQARWLSLEGVEIRSLDDAPAQ